MDKALIDKFSKMIDENDWVYRTYCNFEGKNKWHIICSASNWISVVIDEIDAATLLKENSNEASIKLMKFINCIDILWTAVQQLHRVFFNVKKEVPFEKDKSIFKNKLYDTDDNTYFQTIRACFSAHPVDLKDKFSGTEETERRYASWSAGGIGDGDFTVILYSNQVGREDIWMGICFDELMEFAAKRYNYLEVIMNEMDSQFEKYLSEWRGKPIRKSDDILEQIEILKKEEKERFDNDYYAYILDNMYTAFTTKIHGEQNEMAIKTYQAALLAVVEKIYTNLQNMNLEDIDDSVLEINIPEDCSIHWDK